MPNCIRKAFAAALKTSDDVKITFATLDDPDQGLPPEVLDNTDVLMWWGHMAHDDVSDELVKRIYDRVYKGMGLIILHSGHWSKVFKAVVGTNGHLTWGTNRREVIWTMNAAHPIAAGVPEHFSLPLEELYAEPFGIPTPDELVFTSWFEGGFVFRSGCCWTRGSGKVFYFQPGHEECKSYDNPHVQRILRNAVHWAAPGELGYAGRTDCIGVGSADVTND